jgi:hypothetical protein
MGCKSGLIMKLQMVIIYYLTLFEDFVQLVIPVLQNYGIFREDYEGTTLHAHLGLQVLPFEQ